MSQYTHRMTLVVPESLMSQANQLALIAGESPEDVNTFTQANYQDSSGNLYAVCSTVVKPIVLELINKPLAESVLISDIADIELAQQAMDNLIIYNENMVLSANKIIVGIDINPLTLFKNLGLFIKEELI